MGACVRACVCVLVVEVCAVGSLTVDINLTIELKS